MNPQFPQQNPPVPPQPQAGYQQPQQAPAAYPQQQQMAQQPPAQGFYQPPPQQPQAYPQQQQYPQQPQQMPAQQGGVFAGINNAQQSNNNNYCRAGVYYARINTCKMGYSKSDNMPYVAVEMTVVRVLDNAAGQGHNLGEDVTFFTKKHPKYDYFAGEVREFCSCALGIPFESTKDTHAEMVFGPAQPLANTTICFRGTNKPTQNGGMRTEVKFNMGEVPAAVLKQELDPQSIQMFYPNGALDLLEQQQAAAQGQAPVAQPQQPQGYGQPMSTPQPAPAAPMPAAPAAAPMPQAPAPAQIPPAAPGQVPPPIAPPTY